ncbi:putative rRNA 2'-O-methyltransferase fibrillarin 3 [Daucus carota subsp. sativus]|uniref:putative rRNA 2'-O-methyltransferase fibrillarin 3 n=1 Tax=Daucus carota subsp. sativus TaxID=79200 RepID=UPI0007EFDAF9|nr:PREDICTED: putative rRNA 2'-O-methyltransferase fibrillarin 3 [Daucus carota subsp. sativus]
MDDKLTSKLRENRRRVEENYMKNRFCRPDIFKHKADGTAVDEDTSKPGNKRKAPSPAPFLKYYFLFEFASGYALFEVHGMHKFHDEWFKVYDKFTEFRVAEKYINSNPFILIAFYRFSSPADALIQMKAICNSTVTKELKGFIVNSLSELISGYRLAISNALLAHNIYKATGKLIICGQVIQHVMRGLRVKFDKFIVGLELGDLKMARLNLARSYRGHNCGRKESSTVQRIFHNVVIDNVIIVPHKFEGLFIAKGLGKKNFICTKNLVPGKVLCDDQLISVQNENDKTEVEYRVWNPRVSKLAAAVLGGLTNIWIKPGSRLLYLGDVCGSTVLQLSDLVGSDGLVYVIGLSDVVANTVEERLNVITLPGNYSFYKDDTTFRMADNSMCLGQDYHMVIGMVDVILGDIIYRNNYWQMSYIASYALHHLKTGGHYLISSRAKNINLSSQVKDPFADDEWLAFGRKMEFKTNELVMLESLGRGHVMTVGGYRMA